MDNGTIYGENTTYDRIAKDSMTPSPQVALDHDYYSANPERARKKMKEVEDSKKPSGYEMGYNGKEKPEGKDYNRVKKAMGGVCKWRHDFPGTSA